MKILWINPVGTDLFDRYVAETLAQVSRSDTVVDVVSLPKDRPKHLEYHGYEGLVVGDIVKISHAWSDQYDGIVIGCYYDVGLREAREVSKRAIVVAPCQASLTFAAHLGNCFSVLVGRRKWVPKMTENIRCYGYESRLASMRMLDFGVYDFQCDRQRTLDALLTEGRKAVEEDGAEVLILGCTVEFGFYEKLQEALQVPVIDAIFAPFKLIELLTETAGQFHWYPSRRWGSQSPPQDEIDDMGLFADPLACYVGNIVKGLESDRC